MKKIRRKISKDTKIKDAFFSPKVSRTLAKNIDEHFINQPLSVLATFSKKRLLSLKGFGYKAVNEVIYTLDLLGLKLSEHVSTKAEARSDLRSMIETLNKRIDDITEKREALIVKRDGLILFAEALRSVEG